MFIPIKFSSYIRDSGGPAFKGERVIGVAFQNLQRFLLIIVYRNFILGASNIGFIIPVPIIQHFLQVCLL